MVTKEEREKLNKKYEKEKTPYDNDIKHLTMDISNWRQLKVDFQYKIKFIEELLERSYKRKKELEKKAKDYQNGKI